MSAKTGTLYWISTILDAEGLDPTDKLLLIAIADYVGADDSGYVGMEKLAARVGVSYGTVRRRLAALEASGRVCRDRMRRADGNLSVYTFELRREAFGDVALARNLRDGQRAPGRAMTSARQDARAVPPRVEPPHTETPQPPAAAGGDVVALVAKLDSSLADAHFDAFWKTYPRRVGRNAARRAWDKIVKAGTPPGEIIEGARRYAADPHRTPQFTAHPSTWLNAGRWMDETPTPARKTGGVGGMLAAFAEAAVEPEDRVSRGESDETDATAYVLNAWGGR